MSSSGNISEYFNIITQLNDIVDRGKLISIERHSLDLIILKYSKTIINITVKIPDDNDIIDLIDKTIISINGKLKLKLKETKKDIPSKIQSDEIYGLKFEIYKKNYDKFKEQLTEIKYRITFFTNIKNLENLENLENPKKPEKKIIYTTSDYRHKKIYETWGTYLVNINGYLTNLVDLYNCLVFFKKNNFSNTQIEESLNKKYPNNRNIIQETYNSCLDMINKMSCIIPDYNNRNPDYYEYNPYKSDIPAKMFYNYIRFVLAYFMETFKDVEKKYKSDNKDTDFINTDTYAILNSYGIDDEKCKNIYIEKTKKLEYLIMNDIDNFKENIISEITDNHIKYATQLVAIYNDNKPKIKEIQIKLLDEIKKEFIELNVKSYITEKSLSDIEEKIHKKVINEIAETLFKYNDKYLSIQSKFSFLRTVSDIYNTYDKIVNGVFEGTSSTKLYYPLTDPHFDELIGENYFNKQIKKYTEMENNKTGGIRRNKYFL